jgi:hypothetical protein
VFKPAESHKLSTFLLCDFDFVKDYRFPGIRHRQGRPVHGILHYQRRVRILGELLSGGRKSPMEGEEEEEDFLGKSEDEGAIHVVLKWAVVSESYE